MPWRQVDAMTERFQFIRDARQRLVTFTDLCALYGISRVTGYKWLHRAEQSGLDFLQELSRRPHGTLGNPGAIQTAMMSPLTWISKSGSFLAECYGHLRATAWRRESRSPWGR